MTRVLATVLAVLALVGAWLLTRPVPAMISTGLILAAFTPLSFMIWQAIRHRPGRRSHPVLTSVGCGMGCVMVMAGVHRYGDDHQWILVGALAALCIWMYWQRYVWRAGPQ